MWKTILSWKGWHFFIGIFSGLAILAACLAFFDLIIAHFVEQKTHYLIFFDGQPQTFVSSTRMTWVYTLAVALTPALHAALSRFTRYGQVRYYDHMALFSAALAVATLFWMYVITYPHFHYKWHMVAVLLLLVGSATWFTRNPRPEPAA